jgi:ABC-2 type transport system permease protein
MIRVELRKLLTRPRTWITIALLAGLPTVVGVFVKATGVGPRPGRGPALLSEVLSNGVLFPAAALAIVLPLFLPIAVSVVAGDTVAGEASFGTLRYLLIRPVPRARLLVAKLVSALTFVVLATVTVAVVGLIVGWALFGVRPLTTVSGVAVDNDQILLRVGLAVLYVAVSMFGVAAIGVFASTRTDSPLAATLATLAAFVASQVLDLIDAAGAVHPYLPTHYWLAFVDLFREPVYWNDLLRGLGIQGVYIAVFLGLAWAGFATKDVTA